MQSLLITDDADPGRTQHSEKFHLWLDEPKDWALKVRRLRLSGWCVAKKGDPLVAIRARVGGRVFVGKFDRERIEVPAFIGMPDAPTRCGFTVDVRVPFGRKRLELQVATADGRWHKAFARTVAGPLFVSEPEQRLWDELEEADAARRYVLVFSRPTDWQKPRRKLYLAGWCVDRNGGWMHGIRAVVGERVFVGHHGIPRPDLATQFPELPSAVHSGFAVVADLPPSRSVLALQIKTVDGEWRRIFSQEVYGATERLADEEEISVEEAPFFVEPHHGGSRFHFWLDRPSDWSEKVHRLRVSGWCVAAWGEGISELRARIRGKVIAARYGILRPDVAAGMDRGADALRSGFSVDVNVPLGRSSLVLEARSEGGAWEPFFETRVRGRFRWQLGSRPENRAGNYSDWIQLYDELSLQDSAAIRRQIEAFGGSPKFSILLSIHEDCVRSLRRTAMSLAAQLYDNWELCAVVDSDTQPRSLRWLKAKARRDGRIKIVPRSGGGLRSNAALTAATGDFIALLVPGDQMAPTALYFAALESSRTPSLQLIYPDSDRIDARGRRTEPHFKSDWNPDLFTSENYLSPLVFHGTDLVRQVGGFHEEFDAACHYDLTLRCIEQISPAQIKHIPHVLCHSVRKPAAEEEEPPCTLALQQHLDRQGIAARAVRDGTSSQVIYSPPDDTPLVSIIIPTRDRTSLLRQCVQTILTKTDYPHFEIIIVDNESSTAEAQDYLQLIALNGRVRVIKSPGDFNYSKLNNVGVTHGSGQFIALLNNDLEVVNSGWLTEMVSHAARPEVGAVGALLRYPDGRIQHGGVILGIGGVATHAHGGLREGEDYSGRAHLVQNFSAVTGACMVLRKQVYEQLRGLDEVNLAVAFNDVDFCLRLRAAGFRVVWTPYAELMHHESASRGLDDTGAKQQRFLAEVEYMRRTWGPLLEADPFYNPNLSIESDEQFELAFPPRVKRPWREIPV